MTGSPELMPGWSLTDETCHKMQKGENESVTELSWYSEIFPTNIYRYYRQ
jgi:hypothetical protein